MKYKGYNVLTLKTSNEEIHHIQLALGIDLGTCRFATIATTEGNVEIIGSEPLNHYCMLIEAGESTEASMNMWLFKKVKSIVQDWYDRGVEAVYVGCCKGDYLTLCGGDENHPFYKHKVFETFIKYLEAFNKLFNYINDIGIYAQKQVYANIVLINSDILDEAVEDIHRKLTMGLDAYVVI